MSKHELELIASDWAEEEVFARAIADRLSDRIAGRSEEDLDSIHSDLEALSGNLRYNKYFTGQKAEEME